MNDVKVHIRRAHPGHVQYGTKLTSVLTGLGLPSIEDLQDELIHYSNILQGREPSPVDSPYLKLMEVATAYHGRAREIEMRILIAEERGEVLRGSPLYKFRTGPLQSFIESSKRWAELGSRRMTQEQLTYQQRMDAGGV